AEPLRFAKNNNSALNNPKPIDITVPTSHHIIKHSRHNVASPVKACSYRRCGIGSKQNKQQ
ncbi:hypothetical protein, partial [Klebsiella pneumoniae]|uniref:hypothetical protein n=1 Tax=Klebsiella pneumoniae TaxID=573 RepID=UPI0028F747C1